LRGTYYAISGSHEHPPRSRSRMSILAAALIAGISIMPQTAVAQLKKGDITEVDRSFKDYKGTVKTGDTLVKMDFEGGKDGSYALRITRLDEYGAELIWQRRDGSATKDERKWRVDYGEKKRLGDLNLWFRVLLRKGSKTGSADVELKYLHETTEKRSVGIRDYLTERSSFSDLKVTHMDGKGIDVVRGTGNSGLSCKIPYGEERVIGDYALWFRVNAVKRQGKKAVVKVTFPAVGFPKAGDEGICEKR